VIASRRFGFINFDVPNLHTKSRQRRIRQWSDPWLSLAVSNG
jgi:hypothetical protein